jgi:hypothetical protein
MKRSQAKKLPSCPAAGKNTGSQGAQVLTPEPQALVAATVEEGLRIQNQFRQEPLYKNAGQGCFDSRTVEEIAAEKEPGKDSQ